MLRNKSLIPLSHQHQHALALCVRLDRALAGGSLDLKASQDEVARAYESEIRFHFEAEEKVLFPAAEKYPALQPLIKQLLAEHVTLRGLFSRAQGGHLDAAGLKSLGEALSRHIRTEERELFELCQKHMSADEMAHTGAGLERYFVASGMPGASCDLSGTRRSS